MRTHVPPSPTMPSRTKVLVRRGQPPSLEDAYREHGSSVLGLARRLVGDRSLAEEITQEVFLRLWRRPERFDADRGSLRTFLLADCHGRSIDAVRSASARRRRELGDAHSQAGRPAADVASDVCDTIVHERVAGLVRALPDGERDAISLAYCEHLTYREVAEVLGTPEGTVKGRIRSGLRRVRSDLSLVGIDVG